MDQDRFTLTPAPTTRRARFIAKAQAKREEAERPARREPGYAELKARVYLVVSGADLVDAYDPAEGSTLESVLSILVARVQAARDGRNPPTRWWSKDLAIWQAGRLLAVIRPDDKGHPVTLVFNPTTSIQERRP